MNNEIEQFNKENLKYKVILCLVVFVLGFCVARLLMTIVGLTQLKLI